MDKILNILKQGGDSFNDMSQIVQGKEVIRLTHNLVNNYDICEIIHFLKQY